jgi:HSP20 family protein
MTTLLSRPIARLLDDDNFGFPDLLSSTRSMMPSRLLDRHEMTMPAVNIKDNKKNYELELAVPGFKKENLKVNVKDGVLTVFSEQKEENSKEDEGYTRREFSYRSFSRAFSLPDNVDPESVKAKFNDGVLRLTIDKTGDQPESKGREIRIS